MNLSSLSPGKRIVLGIIFIVVGIITGIISVIITIWFIYSIGFLTTAVMYILLTLMTIVSLILWRLRRRAHGFSVVHTWDTEAADQIGSTTRYGFPQDPGAYMPRWILKGQPRKYQHPSDYQ